MTREEASKRFNALSVENRTTIIANELELEIRWLEREKRRCQKDHADNMKIYNGRIKHLERCLNELKD